MKPIIECAIDSHATTMRNYAILLREIFMSPVTTLYMECEPQDPSGGSIEQATYVNAGIKHFSRRSGF